MQNFGAKSYISQALQQRFTQSKNRMEQRFGADQVTMSTSVTEIEETAEEHEPDTGRASKTIESKKPRLAPISRKQRAIRNVKKTSKFEHAPHLKYRSHTPMG